MRIPLIAAALCVAASSALAGPPDKKAAPAGDGVAWEASYSAAKERATGEGKLLFVDVLTDG